MKKAALILGIIFIPIFIIIIWLFLQPAKVTPPPKAAITMWGFDAPENYADAINTYHAQHPYATVTYVQKQPDNWRQQLVEAWALGTGPDVFVIPNQQVKQYQQFLVAAPVSTPSYTYTKTKTLGIKEDTKITKTMVAGPTPTSIRQEYIDTVLQDAIIGGQVYGLPISVESLVLFSNRDMLNRASIPFAATTWDEFIKEIPKLTLLDSQNHLVQSGAALGTSTNVNHSEDILALLMLQNGVNIVDSAGTTVLLNQKATAASQALSFYTDFANQAKSIYSWNADQDQALNAFAAGKVAYFIGYPSDDATIKSRSTGINYDISAVPQVNTQKPVNIANYKIFAVSKSAKEPLTTWNFVQYLTGREGATLILNKSLQTPARKDLIAALLASNDQVVQVKNSQALTAVSWYRGTNEDKARTLIREAITKVNTNPNDVRTTLDSLASQLQILLTQ